MKMKKIISYIFSFFLAFFLFLVALLCVCRFTIASEMYFLAKLDGTDYYESAVTEYNRLLKQNARPTNFPVELFDNYVVASDVSDDMIAYIKGELRGEAISVTSDQFRNRLVETTNAYMNENSIAIDTKTQVAIDTFIDANAENYITLLQFPYMHYYGMAVQMFHTIFLIGVPILLLVCVILTWMQCRMHKSKRRKKRWISYSLIGGGALMSVCPLILLGNRTFSRIQLAPEHLYKVVTTSMNDFALALSLVGILFIVLGLLLTYVKPKKKNNKSKKERNYENSVMLNAIHH